MRLIAIMMMKIMLKKAKNNKIGKDYFIEKAYEHMIRSYETTIMYLESNK